MIPKKHIFIVAGESSGDQHAAKYIKAHQSISSTITFSAIGQNEIKKTGIDLVFNSEEISVVGIVEVISKYRIISKALQTAYDHIREKQPDLIILVDYVEFNLKIARYAKSRGIKVLFYIAPSFHFITSVFILGEYMEVQKFIAFIIIWIAVSIFIYDAVKNSKLS